MKQIKNPKGLFITAKETTDPSDKNKKVVTFTPSDVIPMRAGTGKMVHILDPDSPETITYKGQDYYYSGNALCGAGRPSKSYPYGSSTNIGGAAGFVDYGEEIKLSLGDFPRRGRGYAPITITCYRCLKLHALNKGPVFQRGFAPTTQGHQELHEMLPGGREGFYGEDFEEFGDYTPEVQQAQAELAAIDREYWENQQELFRVGAPYARTQPETIEPYQAAARRFGFDDPEKQVGTFPKTDVIRRKKNPALKVGDRIVEGSRMGTVHSFHSAGTVDVKFDDMDYVIRRQIGSVMKAKKNPAMHPFVKALHQSDLQLALVGGKIGWKMKFTPSCAVEFSFGEPSQRDGAIILSTVEVTSDPSCWNKGYGSKAMQKILSLADKTNTTLKLFASPMGASQLTAQELKKWYKKFGFKELQHNNMIRIPSTAVKKNPSVRAEIQRMINTAPSSWLTMFKRYKLGSKPTVAKLISTVLEFTPSMNRYGDKGSTVYTPPKQVRSEALAGLRLSYKHNYSSASGIGLVRAMQLAVEPTVWRRTVERMFAYFDRHISDTESSTFGNNVQPSRGWIAWLNWGGTAGYEWSASILGKQRKLMFGERGYDRNDRSKRVKSRKLPVAANPSYRYDACKEAHYPPGSWVMLLTLEGKDKPPHLRCCAHPTPVVVMDVHPIPKSNQGMIQYFDPEAQKTGFWPCDSVFWSDHTSDLSQLQSRRGIEKEYVTAKKGFKRMLEIFVDQSKEPFRENPSERKQGILFENYDPRSAQFTAQVQGVYESLVRKELGKKSTTKFKTAKGVRLDSRFSQPRVSRILGNAFAVATRAGQKYKYLKKGTNKPTAKGKQRAAERQKDKPHLMENILDYETTLYLARKNREPRILKKGKRFYIMPEGTYRGTLQAAIDYIKRKQKRGGRRIANPSKVDPSSPQFSEARFYSGKFRVVVDKIPVYHPADDYRDIPDDKKRVIGKRDTYFIAGSKSVFSVLKTTGFKQVVSSRAMRETYEREDLGRPPEEISLAETTRALATSPMRVKLLQFINKHYRSLPALPPKEGDPPPKMPAKFSLFNLMQDVATGAVGIGVYNQVELLKTLQEFVQYGVITKERYPAAARIVRERTKQLKELKAKENELAAEINKLSGQQAPAAKRALAAAQRQLLNFRTENIIFDDANIRDVAGDPETFEWVMPSASIFAAKELGVLPNYAQERGLESQRLVLFNPMFRYQIRPRIEKMTGEESTINLFGTEVKTTVLRIEGQERKVSKATGDEVFLQPVFDKKFRVTPKTRKRRGEDREIRFAKETALKNYYAIIQQAAQKYQDDNPEIDINKGLEEGTINIPTKYFAALTLLDWVRVDRFLLDAVNKGKGTNYIAEIGGIKIAGGVAYSVVKYAQARGLPLPNQKVLTPRTAEQRSASKKSKTAPKTDVGAKASFTFSRRGGSSPVDKSSQKATFTRGSASSSDPSEGTPIFTRKKK